MLWSLFFFACGDKSVDSASDLPPATFTEIENELLGVSCAFSTCHGGNAGGLMLDEARICALVAACCAVDWLATA